MKHQVYRQFAHIQKLMAVALCAALLSVPAAAQTTDQAKAVRKQFDDCVWRSVIQQVKQLRLINGWAIDADNVTETAFVTCQTEEAAMRAFLALINVPHNQAVVGMLSLRLQIKKDVRDTVEHPERYIH